MLRGRMKCHVIRLISKFYPIHPKADLFKTHPNPTVATRRYVEQKVSELLGAQSLYLCGIIRTRVPLRFVPCRSALLIMYPRWNLYFLRTQQFASSFIKWRSAKRIERLLHQLI